VTLGLKEVERVLVAGRDAQTLRHLIERDVLIFGRMNAAQIDGEPAVDEDPQIVVAAELRYLAAGVAKASVQLERE